MKKIYTKAMIGMLTLTMAIGVGALLSNIAIKNTNHNSNNVNSVNAANAVKIDGNNEVSPDYVIATKIYNDRYGYYLSNDGNKFAAENNISIKNSEMDFGAFGSNTLDLTFHESTYNPGQYYVSFFYVKGNLYLHCINGQSQMNYSENGSSLWEPVKDSVGFYLVNRTVENRYIGLTSPGASTAIPHPASSYHGNDPPVYVYEKSSTQAAYSFVEEFNKRLGTTGTGYSGGICQSDGTTDLAELEKAWNGATEGDVKSLKTIFNEKRDSLSESQKTEFDNIFANTTPKANGDIIQRALSLYNFIVNNRHLEDFINEREAISSNVTIDNASNNSVIIVVISSILVASLGGFLLIRRKKDQ